MILTVLVGPVGDGSLGNGRGDGGVQEQLLLLGEPLPEGEASVTKASMGSWYASFGHRLDWARHGLPAAKPGAGRQILWGGDEGGGGSSSRGKVRWRCPPGESSRRANPRVRVSLWSFRSRLRRGRERAAKTWRCFKVIWVFCTCTWVSGKAERMPQQGTGQGSLLRAAVKEGQKGQGLGLIHKRASFPGHHRGRNCQKATALAAATFRESTPWDMGMQAVSSQWAMVAWARPSPSVPRRMASFSPR